MTQTFDFNLTDQDIETIRQFMIALQDKEFFSSDDFRAYGLHLNMNDPAHEIGTLFAKLKANGVAEPVGEVPSEVDSNNKRKVDLWRFCWTHWKQIIHNRLEVW